MGKDWNVCRARAWFSILMMRLNYSYMDRCMCNGGNVAFLWIVRLSSIYYCCKFFQCANSAAIWFHNQIWPDFRFTSLLQQTNQVRKSQVCWFLNTYNISSKLPKFYQNNTNNCRNNVQNDRHYFKV